MGLVISRAHLAAIRAHADAAGAEECCGLLLGDPASGRVQAIQPAPNVAAQPVHFFEIDPATLLAAYRAARRGGPAVIGHYHSHPHGTAEPSAVDAAMAERRGEIWLILGGDGTARAWRAGSDGAWHGCFTPLPLASDSD